jgi:hypothetical protein
MAKLTPTTAAPVLKSAMVPSSSNWSSNLALGLSAVTDAGVAVFVSALSVPKCVAALAPSRARSRASSRLCWRALSSIAPPTSGRSRAAPSGP